MWKCEGLSAALACMQLLYKSGQLTADNADLKWSAACNAIARAAGCQASMLQHTLHKLHVMTVSLSNPAAQHTICKYTYVVTCTMLFGQHPAAVLPLQCYL